MDYPLSLRWVALILLALWGVGCASKLTPVVAPGQRTMLSARSMTTDAQTLEGPVSEEVSNIPESPVTLAWDANTEPVTGYKVYTGTNSHVYTQWYDVGNITQFTLAPITAGVRNYYAVSAYITTSTQPPTSTLTAPGKTVVGKP